MITTSALPPAYAYVRSHGDLLKQFGAASIEATDGFTIKATYTDNSKAVNAEALLKDEVWGAKLVVDNQSMTPDAPTVSANGIADLLRGVAGLAVEVRTMRCPGSPSTITATTADEGFARLVRDLVEEHPAPGIDVNVVYGNDIEQ